MKMRNKRKALHKKYSTSKKAWWSFQKLYKGEMAQRLEKVKQWMKDNPLVFGEDNEHI